MNTTLGKMKAPSVVMGSRFRGKDEERGRMRLFYQSLGASRRSTDGPYAQKLAAILQNAAASGTTVEVHGLSPGKAIADQYRYLEYSGPGAADQGIPIIL